MLEGVRCVADTWRREAWLSSHWTPALRVKYSPMWVNGEWPSSYSGLPLRKLGTHTCWEEAAYFSNNDKEGRMQKMEEALAFGETSAVCSLFATNERRIYRQGT